MAGRSHGTVRNVHHRVLVALHGRDGQIRATSALRLVAGRHGRPHASQCVDSRGDDGNRRRLRGRALAHFVHVRTDCDARGRHCRLRHGFLRRDDWPGADRHQARSCLFHRQPARLHVPGVRGGRVWGWHFSLNDARVFQSAAVPGRGFGDSRHRRRAGHDQDGRPQQENSLDLRNHAGGNSGHSGRPWVFRFLQQRRHSGSCSGQVLALRIRPIERLTDLLLHVPADFPNFLRETAL